MNWSYCRWWLLFYFKDKIIMENIKVIVHTNLDDYDCSMWNKIQLPTRPLVGDFMDVMYKGASRRLKIVSVEHGFKKQYENHQLDYVLKIELSH